MPKDYTDYVLFICGAGDRVFFLEHIRSNEQVIAQHDAGKLLHTQNDWIYHVNLDSAYLSKWSPWSKAIKRQPKVKTSTKDVKEQWYFGTAKGELAKVPVIAKKTIRTTKQPIMTLKVFASIREVLRPKRVGTIFFQEPCTNRCSQCPKGTKNESCPSGIVEPMHISRIHQPSGEMRG